MIKLACSNHSDSGWSKTRTSGRQRSLLNHLCLQDRIPQNLISVEWDKSRGTPGGPDGFRLKGLDPCPLKHGKDISLLDSTMGALLTYTIFKLLPVISCKRAKDTDIKRLENMSQMGQEADKMNVVIDCILDEYIVLHMC